MSLDPLMEKWIKSSVQLYFANTPSMVMEGDPEPADAVTWAELRFNGPRILKQDANHYKIELDLNISCTNKISNDLYALEKLVGSIRQLCEAEIPINKYGDTNPAEFIGCFHLRDNVPYPIDVIPWGKVTVDASSGPIRVFNTTLDAYYVMEL